MKDAQKPDHVSLNVLVNRMKEGRFVIPDFQREFEWKPWDIRDLMRSIFSDYYVGSLLLWKSKPENISLLSCEGLYGFSGSASPEYIVLDGQQRLTAMHYAFIGPDVVLPNRTKPAVYYIDIVKYLAGETDSAFGYDWVGKHIANFLNDQDALYQAHYFPLSVVGTGGFALSRWIGGYESFWRKRATEAENEHDRDLASAYADSAERFGLEIQETLEQYQISYVELDKDLGAEKVCDIFTQINSKGVQLDVFDLLNALMKPKGVQLKHMYREAREQLSFVDTPKMNVYILQVMSISRQNYCSPKFLYFLQPEIERPTRLPDGTMTSEVLVKSAEEFLQLWQEAVTSLDRVINLLRHPQEYGVIGPAFLPYASMLPAFASIHALIAKQPANRQLTARTKVRQWYWASVFLSRYSSSVETTAARDFIAMQRWMEDDDAKPEMINEFAQTFRSLDLRKEQKRGTSVYSAIFNLFVVAGARDWMTGDVPVFQDLDDHHIVPASWGRKNGLDREINTILNRSPLTSETNRHVIRDKLPNEYLPSLILENGEAAVMSILESHFISKNAVEILLRDPFTSDDFEAFIQERRRTLLDAIENLLIKERFDLPQNLRAIDQKIENIELALRSIIVDRLDDDAEALPDHLLVGARDRIQRAARKNAAMRIEDYENATGVLEYFDLRGLQDAILSKALWEKFADVFANKATLGQKFSQLADLRNSIRHSRAVDEITQMEGEAAIIWFDQVLGKLAD